MWSSNPEVGAGYVSVGPVLRRHTSCAGLFSHPKCSAACLLRTSKVFMIIARAMFQCAVTKLQSNESSLLLETNIFTREAP
jgi:hypothetical protein